MGMARKAIDSFRNGDPGSAREVLVLDRRCNEIERETRAGFMEMMRKDGDTVERALHAIFAARSLERVGDLSTNIAESVIFIEEGLNIKHSCPQKV